MPQSAASDFGETLENATDGRIDLAACKPIAHLM